MSDPLLSRSLQNLSNPRLFAVQALKQFDNGKIVLDSLGQTIADSKLNLKDKPLAFDLTANVIRRKGTLDTLISIYSSREINSLDRFVANSLRIGFYQLIYMRKIPRFAAVDESVKLVKKKFGTKTGGFVNAVLRSYIRNPKKVEQTVEKFTELKRMAFELSHPEWIIKRWAKHFDIGTIQNFCNCNNCIPPVVIRVNINLISVSDYKAVLKKAGCGFVDSPVHPDCLRISHGQKIEKLPGYDKGFFAVQDETPVMIIDKLGIEHGDSVLDVCAAPGGKSFYASLKTGNTGTVLSLDINAGRIKKLELELKRLNINNIKTVAQDAVDYVALSRKIDRQKFKKMIVDVPCSNTGVLRRRAEARWRLKEDDFNRLSVLQMKLLRNASEFLEPGGKLLYSTCSIDPVENEENIAKFLKENPAFKLIEKKLFIPQKTDDPDGGFAAVLIKQF